MQLSETVLAEELDRLITSTVLRIEQQRIHVRESSACHHQMAVAERGLHGMMKGLQQLRLYRAQFA
jgi:hypothetical protein